MNKYQHTVITFAPVQGFIEKSRKLRDLYGSSYLLSYLSWVICNAADQTPGCQVISPALLNITQGMPNQIIIQGDFPQENANLVFKKAWECVTETCREWIQENIKGDAQGEFQYTSWKRNWGLWTKYGWEFFWVQGKISESEGESINDAREKLNERKRWRDWTGINWQGESSTLSGTDAIACPHLGQIWEDYQKEKVEVKRFYQALSDKLGESFIDPNEELSVPELIKRIITYDSISQKLIKRLRLVFGQDGANTELLIKEIEQISVYLNPSSFKDLSRHKEEQINDKLTKEDKGFQGWFQGDGDNAGNYLKKFPEKTNEFSTKMREWGKFFKERPLKFGRVIYAGGDDFLGVFYDKEGKGEKLQPKYCVDWFTKFKQEIWQENKVNPSAQKPITVSIGFVWAFRGIPQRDVLQHCREAEKSAKNQGRDRIAWRILFNNGNYLEWVCPWWLLESGLLSNYRDREKNETKEAQNWTHIYNDVAVLESRHAFDDEGLDIALALFEIYFPHHVDVIKDQKNWLHESNVDLTVTQAGILGDRKNYEDNTKEIDEIKRNKALTDWIINLAKVGFHLCQ